MIALVELPGMRKEDIEISLHDGTLTISGERKSETPTRVDASKVSATYRDGILTVTLPKAEEAKPKQIQVDAG